MASDRSITESLELCQKNGTFPCQTAIIKAWGQKWDREMSRKIYAQIIRLEEEIQNKKDIFCSASNPRIDFMSTQ